MKKLSSLMVSLFILMVACALVFTGCNDASTVAPSSSAASDPVVSSSTPEDVREEVEIVDMYGPVNVPVNPERVVALDNRTFATLYDWGVKLVAAPKAIMPAGLPYKDDASIPDIGSHNDPNLEILAAANPDLVINGQRFAGRQDAIKELVPEAVVINLNFDVSVNAESSGDNLVKGFTEFTRSLGKIFEKEAEAEKLVADFNDSIELVKAAYNKEDTVMTVIVSGGNIGFSAPGSGRVWGPLYDIFDWTSSLYVDGASSDHQGDEISIEAIAQSNPDWIFVLDRDAATSSADGAMTASDVISNSPALQNVTAVIEGQVFYAPSDTYTNESIQTFTQLFNDLAAVLAK